MAESRSECRSTLDETSALLIPDSGYCADAYFHNICMHAEGDGAHQYDTARLMFCYN